MESLTNLKEDTQKGNKSVNVLVESVNDGEKDLIQSLLVKQNEEKAIPVQEIVSQLKKMGFQLDFHEIAFFSEEISSFIFCGMEPLPLHMIIHPADFSSNNTIVLKVRKPISSISQELNTDPLEPLFKSSMGLEYTASSNKPKAEQGAKEKSETADQNFNRRIPERKIGDVVQKVSIWRKLYNGYYDNYGSFVKMTLQDAANSVGISKKSLDDYLMQIRFGRRFGFNFNEHAFDNFGSLRTFVKKKKQMEREKAMADSSSSGFESSEEEEEEEAKQDAKRVKKNKITK